MQFPIELRHLLTGMSKTFDDKQQVADFLAQRNEADWTGWESLGELPEPSPIITTGSPIVDIFVDPIKAMPPEMADADPDHGEPEAVGAVEMSAGNPLGLQSVADAQAAGTVSEQTGV